MTEVRAEDSVAVKDSAGESRLLATKRRTVLRGILSDGSATAGLFMVIALGAVALLAPQLAPYDPIAFVGERLDPPSSEHLFGTDRLGRDILSRIIYGTRLSIGAGFLAAALILILGVLVGAVSGYVGGLLDATLMRIADTILAFPSLILALVIAGLFNPSLTTVMLAMASVWWVTYARIIRGLVMSARERPFIEAARAVGASEPRILVRHILPNVMSPVVVLATLEIGSIILAITALNFLGLGAQPPTPEWGAMLNDGRPSFFGAPHVMIFPGLAISLTVLAFNLLGDGLRDTLDPRTTAIR